MIEQLKQKAVQAMLTKLGEQMQSNGTSFTALVKIERLDSGLGKTFSTRFKQVTVYLPEEKLNQIGQTLTVRGVEYEVVERDSVCEYNGLARVLLTEMTQQPVSGTWR